MTFIVLYLSSPKLKKSGMSRSALRTLILHTLGTNHKSNHLFINISIVVPFFQAFKPVPFLPADPSFLVSPSMKTKAGLYYEPSSLNRPLFLVHKLSCNLLRAGLLGKMLYSTRIAKPSAWLLGSSNSYKRSNVLQFFLFPPPPF